MLLALSAPNPEFGPKAHGRSPVHHTYSTSSSFQSSPKHNRASLPSFAKPDSPTHIMSQPHRGLPPPAAMTLPEPGRSQAIISQQAGSGPGQMPAPPSQWQGAEESMRSWLLAKAEEDKRRQEELRLEKRKIDQSMLRESMKGGIPLHLIPMMFIDSGGAYSPISQDWLSQYSVHLQGAQHQALQAPSDQRDPRPTVASHQHTPYGTTSQAAVLPALASQQQTTGSLSGSSYRGRRSPSGTVRHSPSGVSSSSLRQVTHTSLPKLTTSDRQHSHSTSGQPGIQIIQQGQPSQQAGSSSATSASQAEQQSTATPILFHHWTPNVNQGANTSGSAASAVPSDYAASPKKRKAQGSHQPTPGPSSARHYVSPSFSHASSSTSTAGRRGGHSRERSDASARGYDGSSSAAQSSRRGTFSAGVPEEPSSAPAETYVRGSSPPEPLHTKKTSLRRHTRSDEDYQHRRYRERSGAMLSSSSSQYREGHEQHYEEH